MAKDDISHEKMIFRDSIGQKATVEREEYGPDTQKRLTERLIDLGLAYQKEPELRLEHFRYRGSAAIHIFSNDILHAIQFAPQVKPLLMHRCPEDLAAKAFEDLLRAMKNSYGKSHGKLRSGF